MAGEEGTMMLSSIDSQALKVGITKRKAEETAVAGEGCTTKRKAEETAVAGEKVYTTKRKAAVGSGDGGLILKEEKLQVEVKPSTGSEVLRTLSSDSDISQPDELETLISNSSEPDESKNPSPNSSVSEESGADDSEPEDLEEFFSEQWANMMAELGFEDSDFANYGKLAAMDKQGVEEAA